MYQHIKDIWAKFSSIDLTTVVGITAALIIFIFLTYFLFRDRSASNPAVKLFLKRKSMSGELHQTQIEAWQQQPGIYKNHFFFIIACYLQDSPHLECATVLLSMDQMPLLRKGLPIIVKKGSRGRLVVMQLGDVELNTL